MYICVDIETLENPIDADELQDAEVRIRDELVREDAIQKRIEAFKDSWKFSPEGARLLAVGVATISSRGKVISAPECHVIDDARLLSEYFYTYVEEQVKTNNEPTKIVTFNGERFDIPILFGACMKHLAFSGSLNLGQWDFVDLKKFRPLSGVTWSLDRIAKLVGVETSELDGSMVADMWEQDKKDNGQRVKNYCKQDVQALVGITQKMLTLFKL